MGSLPHVSVIKGPVRQLTPNYINKLFENVADTVKTRTALIFKEHEKTVTHTYEELDKLTNKLARSIQQEIIAGNLLRNNDGDYIVAVNMLPSDYLIIVLLSIWKAGAAYLPLDHGFPASRIEHIINEAKPSMVIYDKDSKSYLNTHKLSVEEIVAKSSSQSEDPLTDGEVLKHIKDDLAIVLYTSGSTGVPKGVRLPHKVILNRLQWQFKTFPFSKTEEVCVFKTALTFVDSISEIWGPLINGLSLLIVPKILTQDPEKFVNLLDSYKIERLVLVPSLLRALLMYLKLQKTRRFLNNLKIWVCSGETLAVSLSKEFYEYFSEEKHSLCNFYGSTEIMGDVTYHVISGLSELENSDSIPIGLPVDNTLIYILDKDLRPVKENEIGELFISGHNLAAGYVNGRDPEKFINNPLAIDPIFSKLFRTGDFARYYKNTILYEGRTDSQVKIRGNRVDLSEIEKALNSILGVEKAVVLCYQPGEINQTLLAFVSTNKQINSQYIKEKLKTMLVSYMLPEIVLIENIPLLVNGKIDRQSLLKTYEFNNNTDSSCEPDIDYTGVPKNKMNPAKVLFETVASVLNRSARSSISVNTNFYEIGGNSLNSIFTISRLADQGYYLNIGDFISAMDLGEILERMTSDIKIKKQPQRFTSELLKNEHISMVKNMVSTSFYNKAELEQFIINEINELVYDEVIDKLWHSLLEQKLSFIVKSEGGKILGVTLSFDARDEPEVEIESKLSVIFEFLDFVEGPVKDNLSGGKGKIVHCFMMATHSSLSPKENVAVMEFMEGEVLRIATKRGFEGILTTNTSPLTQQLGTDVYKYQTMLDYQINQYIASNKTKPFGTAPNDMRAIVQWKPIN